MAYNATKHEVFVRRLQRVAAQIRDLDDECRRLETLWFAENISADAAFVDTLGVATADQTSLITMAQQVQTYHQGTGSIGADTGRKSVTARALALQE